MKEGKVLEAAFASPPFRCTESRIASYSEVLAINRGGDTAPDNDYYHKPGACAVLGVGGFQLSLRSVRFKPGKGEEHGRKDSDRPDFGAKNDPAERAGVNWVPLDDLEVSEPLGGKNGSYKCVYNPFHCYDVPAGQVSLPGGSTIPLYLLLEMALIKEDMGTVAWERVEQLLQQLGALSSGDELRVDDMWLLASRLQLGGALEPVTGASSMQAVGLGPLLPPARVLAPSSRQSNELSAEVSWSKSDESSNGENSPGTPGVFDAGWKDNSLASRASIQSAREVEHEPR